MPPGLSPGHELPGSGWHPVTDSKLSAQFTRVGRRPHRYALRAVAVDRCIARAGAHANRYLPTTKRYSACHGAVVQCAWSGLPGWLAGGTLPDLRGRAGEAAVVTAAVSLTAASRDSSCPAVQPFSLNACAKAWRPHGETNCSPLSGQTCASRFRTTDGEHHRAFRANHQAPTP